MASRIAVIDKGAVNKLQHLRNYMNNPPPALWLTLSAR
jgi:hypothetical protein